MNPRQRLQSIEDSLVDLEKTLFQHPELGFKEVQTKAILRKFFQQHGLDFTEDYGVNGFRITLGQGKPHLALIAELDALVVPDHFAKGPENAAHACGHNIQGSIMAHVVLLMKDQRFKGTLSLYGIAAEEFIDLPYRESLQRDGVIQLLSGKQNLLINDAFKDVDVCIATHTMGETQRPAMEINTVLTGFTYKRLTFHGKAAHAAVNPSDGVNALNAMVLTQNALALLRETFKEEDRIRLHLISTKGGDGVNVVPQEAVLEGYVRAVDPKVLARLSEQVSNAAHHCAAALGASCTIDDRPGYLPLIQSRELNALAKDFIHECVGETGLVDNQVSFAAGDLGDLSLLMPTIQLGFSGCKGTVHGKDFHLHNVEEALLNPSYVVLRLVERLFEKPHLVEDVVRAHPKTFDVHAYKKLHKVA
jgi:amidohydrolase